MRQRTTIPKWHYYIGIKTWNSVTANDIFNEYASARSNILAEGYVKDNGYTTFLGPFTSRMIAERNVMAIVESV
jgi:hypothetical protein